MKDQAFDCPQCGEQTDELHEGCCEACCSDNQAALDDHNFQHDRWDRLGNAERSSEIKRATQ